jgi:hypothetical protein
VSQQNATALGYIKTFSHHHYPGGDVKSLMSHANVVRNVGGFRKDIEVAKGMAGGAREYVFGETNSGELRVAFFLYSIFQRLVA